MASEKLQGLFTPKYIVIAGTLVVAFVLAVYLNLSSVKGPPPMKPDDLTRDRLARLQAELTVFVVREQKLPSDLKEGVTTPTMDGWNKEFTYTPGTQGPKKTSFEIRSMGADGQPETADDWSAKVVFGDDGYGKLGPLDAQVQVPPL
jgi:hypothetical protein